MRDDLSDYQSADTAWRYENRVARLKADIANTEALLRTQKEALRALEEHPPLYHLFNWSA